MRVSFLLSLSSVALLLSIACGGGSDSNPTQPTPVVNPRLTAPAAELPTPDEQLDTLRPTLTVKNGSSDQTGARTYKFQISDTADFSTALTSYITSFNVTVSKTAVPEGADGKTSFTPETDLQPTTRFYWRARMTQGTTVSEWSSRGQVPDRNWWASSATRPGPPADSRRDGGRARGADVVCARPGPAVRHGTSFVRYRLPRR